MAETHGENRVCPPRADVDASSAMYRGRRKARTANFCPGRMSMLRSRTVVDIGESNEADGTPSHLGIEAGPCRMTFKLTSHDKQCGRITTFGIQVPRIATFRFAIFLSCEADELIRKRKNEPTKRPGPTANQHI